VEAMEAKATLDTCNMLDLITSECGQAQNRWDDAIGYAWSLSALGLLAGLVGGIEVQRPDEEGKWPMKQVSVRKHEAIEKSQTSRHNTAKKGSWKSRSEEE